MSIDINEIFILLKKNEWDKILTLEKTNRTDIINDPSTLNFFNIYFIQQIIQHSKTLEKEHAYLTLKHVYTHFLNIRENPYNIDSSLFEQLVEKYIYSLIDINSEKEAYKISDKWKHLTIAKEYIQKYENNHLKEVSHNNDEQVQLKTNKPNSIKSYIPLFKSNQEMEFFYALREFYPNHMIYPNVALSCIIDFKKVKELLTQEEIDYFFKAVVDCVIFKHEDNNFHPDLCFELDSIYHDSKKQQHNDSLKNKILTKSGHNIYRIRSTENKSLKRDELKLAIKDEISK